MPITMTDYMLLGGSHDGEHFLIPSGAQLATVKLANKEGSGIETYYRTELTHRNAASYQHDHCVYALHGIDPIEQLIKYYRKEK